MNNNIFFSIKNKIIIISIIIFIALLFFVLITALTNRFVEREVSIVEKEITTNTLYFEQLVLINTIKYQLTKLLLLASEFDNIGSFTPQRIEKFEIESIIFLTSLGSLKSEILNNSNRIVIEQKFSEKIMNLETQSKELVELIKKKIISNNGLSIQNQSIRDISEKITTGLNELSTLIHLIVINSNVELSMAEKKLNDQVAKSFYISVFISVSAFTLIVVLFYIFANNLLQNIKKSVNFAKIVGSGNFSQKLQINGRDEFGTLSKELNNMSNQLEKFTSSISEKNIELNIEIDERKKTEIKLKQLQTMLLNIINSTPSVIIGIDKHYIITHWNIAAEKKTGVFSDVAVSTDLFTQLPYLSVYKEDIHEVIKHNISKQIFKESFNEEKKYYNLTFSPFDNSQSRGVVLRIDDVTEIELKEEQFMQSQKMETIGSLAGGIAHDFNNILGGIIGIISLIKLNIENDNLKKEDLASDIKIIEEASNRAKNLVNNLLMISKKKEPIFNLVNLNDVLRNVMNICINTFDKSVEIKHIPSVEKSYVDGDQNQIEQLLLNLCVNALHSMTIMRKESEKSGGLLTVSIENIHVDKYFSISHPEAIFEYYWILRVCDTGVGIEPSSISKIFDPFYTTKEKGSGTGLGLSMVYNTVKEHKGFINVYSELNTGTIVSVYIPTKKQDPGKIKNETTEKMLERGAGFILVIDDESIIRYTTKKMLEEYGYTVFSAENGEEGILIYKEHKDLINLVLLDMAMPKISGKETFEELKKINPNIKVIIASGFKMDIRVQETLLLGALDFIHKPYTVSELINIVNARIN